MTDLLAPDVRSFAMFNKTRLSACLSQLGISDPGGLFEKLCDAYGEPGRYYHDETHINECLSHFSSCEQLAERPEEIEAAIWFHDAVYDSRAGDNEEQSAEWAMNYLSAKGAEPSVVSRIVRMILATKSHVSETADEALLLDIDLGILGTSASVFEQYDKNIRKEYEWVPVDEYVEGRTKVLRTFLDRPAIYQTESFARQYEARARDNLSRKIEELAGRALGNS